VRPRLVPALAVAVAALLAGDTVGLVVTADEGGARVAATPGGPTTTVAPDPALDALIDQIETFVERERGLTYTHPVKVTLLDDKDFEARLQRENGRDSKQAKTTERVLKALHLIAEGVDLDKAVGDLLTGSVVGYYDPKTKELVVRGSDTTPYVRSVLAHELTHALDDQRFDLDRPELDRRSDESAQGFTGLVEGNAVRIQERYVGSLSAPDQRAVAREEQSFVGPGPDVPAVLVNLLVFPYRTGPALVQAMLASGGQPRLDAAFKAPPVSSEQLLHPQRFLAGDDPKPVAAPPAGGRIIDKGVFGELGFVLLLAPELGATTAMRAGEGWGGDRYVAWRDGSRTCVRIATVMDSDADRSELVSALRRWAGRHDDVTMDDKEGPVTLTSCG
jgi:hypothetical protein